jgi:small subunit ribosomal protein S19
MLLLELKLALYTQEEQGGQRNKMEQDSFASKQKLFRGRGIDELKKLDTREFAKFLKSRQRRAIMRNFNLIEEFAKRCIKKTQRGKQIKTHERDIIIVPALVGFTINIHNGKEFFPLKISEEMLGHRLGEFSLTRKKVTHGAPGIGATKSSSSMSVK